MGYITGGSVCIGRGTICALYMGYITGGSMYKGRGTI